MASISLDPEPTRIKNGAGKESRSATKNGTTDWGNHLRRYEETGTGMGIG
jgi:hypothetical protein